MAPVYPLHATMNPRPSAVRAYLRGPVRDAAWIGVGALLASSLLLAALIILAEVQP